MRPLRRLRERVGLGRAEAIASSGYFDGEWYRRTYPEVAESGLSPEDHYLREGFRSGSDPGPLFDGNRYLAENGDVAQAGVDPLSHFLRAPASEGRTASTVEVPAPPGHENLTVDMRRVIDPPPSVAVMVHAYYPESFPLLCHSLRSIPVPFSLLVSVPTEEARRVVIAAARLRVEHDLDVRVCPNRGRNFGPLVSEFAGEILDHDYVLHLHTKKSLYTGTEQAVWRDELVGALVGTRAVATAMLELLGHRPDVGIIYPSTTRSLSYWAHHWLSNAQGAPDLFSRLGVTDYPTSGYFPYPVGGMFWARVDAIRPLLEAGLTADDFPVEAGQNDGTLAHAIERSFVPLVHSRGFRFVEFEARSGAFRLDWSALNLDQYLTFSSEGLLRAIGEADLVSFDVFDTILTRLSVRPDSVIRSVGARIGHELPSATGFFERRKRAELAARQLKDWKGDVSLTEIYRQFERDDAWTEEAVSLARTKEVEAELAVSVPRAVIADAVGQAKRAGARVIAVSDTYLERHHIDQLLENAGVADLIDDVYLSSERGVRKDRGDMWDLLVERERPRSGRWLHVGDNEQSDLQAATDRTIATYHCMNPGTLVGLRGLEAIGGAPPDRWGTDLLMGPVVARVANDPYPDTGRFRPVDLPRPFDVGHAVFGPVVMAFLLWLANHPQGADVDRVFFLSREGYLLQLAWERIRAAGATHLPASTYLLSSRRTAMASAQAVRFNPDEIVEGSDFEGTIEDLLSSRLGLELAGDLPFTGTTVRLPRDEEVVRSVLDQVRDRVVDHGGKELAGLVEYLGASGLSSARNPAIVDIGYSATIQKHIQTVAGRGLRGFYMGTLAQASQVREAGGSAFGCFVEDHPGWSEPTPFLLHSLVLEAFLTAPSGQTERAEMRDGRVVASFRADHRTTDELNVLGELHAGALSYCDQLLGAYGRTLLDVPMDPQVALSMVTALATGGIRSHRVAAALVVDDDYCGVPRRHASVAP